MPCWSSGHQGQALSEPSLNQGNTHKIILKVSPTLVSALLRVSLAFISTTA